MYYVFYKVLHLNTSFAAKQKLYFPRNSETSAEPTRCQSTIYNQHKEQRSSTTSKFKLIHQPVEFSYSCGWRKFSHLVEAGWLMPVKCYLTFIEVSSVQQQSQISAILGKMLLKILLINIVMVKRFVKLQKSDKKGNCFFTIPFVELALKAFFVAVIFLQTLHQHFDK